MIEDTEMKRVRTTCRVTKPPPAELESAGLSDIKVLLFTTSLWAQLIFVEHKLHHGLVSARVEHLEMGEREQIKITQVLRSRLMR